MATEPTPTRLDGCPECGTRDNEPHITATTGEATECVYDCRSCGCRWITNWWEGAA